MTEPISPSHRRTGWVFAAVGALSIIVGWPLAAGVYSPDPIGIMPWTRVALFVAVALVCAICFLLCPRRPLVPKFFALLLMLFALFWAVDVLVYRCLNYADYH